MQIQIEQSEIEEAIVSFLRGQGININVASASIEFTASRKGRGIVADIETNVSLKAPLPDDSVIRTPDLSENKYRSIEEEEEEILKQNQLPEPSSLNLFN